MNAYPYHNKHLNGFWDDNMEVPTIYLDPVDDVEIYDARDAWAQTGAPEFSDDMVWTDVGASTGGTAGSGWDWSFSDILKTGTGIAQEVLRYKAMTLPDGQQIYQRYNPYTGQAVYGGRTVAVGAGVGGGISQFINQNMPLLLLAGAGLVILATTGGKKK